MYILGGYDIREGQIESLWMLDLNRIQKQEDDTVEVN
jgi:hypothetical protein